MEAERAGLVGRGGAFQRVRLRVAMVGPAGGYEGAERVCATLTEALARRGHRVTRFAAGQPPPEPDGYDVVHHHTVAGPVHAAPVPTVATVHGTEPGAVDGSVGLVAVSYAQRRHRSDLPWFATVHNGLSPAGPVRAEPGTGPVLWLGRFGASAGADLAVRACRAAGLPLVLAGTCREPDERRYLAGLLAPLPPPGVEVLVNPDRVRCRQLLWDARCLLVPARLDEPPGVAVLEAMGAGTPVVALASGAVPELVAHGETGLLCTAPEELPRALVEVAGLDPAACARYTRLTFSADLMARRYERVYRGWRATRPRAPQSSRPAAAAAVAMPPRASVRPR